MHPIKMHPAIKVYSGIHTFRIILSDRKEGKDMRDAAGCDLLSRTPRYIVERYFQSFTSLIQI